MNLTPEGRFRPVAELRELYAGVGAVPGADVAAYCGSGVTACSCVPIASPGRRRTGPNPRPAC